MITSFRLSALYDLNLYFFKIRFSQISIIDGVVKVILLLKGIHRIKKMAPLFFQDAILNPKEI
jgi:hypothetical protein